MVKGRINSCAKQKLQPSSKIDSNKGFLHKKREVIFSYKYLDTSHTKFKIDQLKGDYFRNLIDRLKSLSTMTPDEMRQSGSKTLRSHTIKWEDVSEDGFGIPNEEEIVSNPWQFSISGNQYGRVHGFWIDDTFYIRWLDFNHQLYNK